MESMLSDITVFHACLFREDLQQCVKQQDAIIPSIWLLVAIIVYSFVWSVIGNNVSKVDQIWSITPWVFCWVFYFHYVCNANGGVHYRLLLVCVLTTLWGIRLTFNFWRRGGYGNFFTHEEDYRWPILRAKMHPIIFLIFNLTFIATYQNILLWLIALPSYVVLKQSSTEINVVDICLGVIFVLLLVMETVADEQHYVFQEYKHSLPADQRQKDASQSVRDGFLQTGLFAFCRHPNYFAEQSIWLVVYLYAVNATREPLHWSCAGIVLLVLLFQGSIQFSESITLAKYPLYKNYQREIPCLLPCYPSADTEEAVAAALKKEADKKKK